MPNASEVAENIVKKRVAAREVESLVKQKRVEKILKKSRILILHLLEMKLKANLD